MRYYIVGLFIKKNSGADASTRKCLIGIVKLVIFPLMYHFLNPCIQTARGKTFVANISLSCEAI